VIGITLTNPTVRTSPVHALGTTVVDLGRFTGDTVGAVVHLFSPSAIASRFHQVVSAKAAAQATRNGTRVQSAYGAVQTAADAVHAGIGSLLLILVSINLFVGVFNLVPMLPLDGGHVAIAVYEKIRSRRRRTPYHADVAKLLPYTWAMVLFLGVLFGTAFLNDVLHPVGNPFG
jgi:membrane-associated protease RseP (regulator of RpoE activity)